ncbi:MAG: hypothetical protein QOI20_4 [Acidimicrobiaceae bacterium]|nr:hypothetical protein [Acidimicrobiaceae bacterium]
MRAFQAGYALRMATNCLTIHVPPDVVFAVLADGRSYEHWLVGCKRIRGVDEGWPKPGTRIHHRVGAGPFTLDDTTKVVESERPARLVLEARARPIGVARVDFTLEAEGEQDCLITMQEHPVRGPAKSLHNPLFEAMISARNQKSLKQLRDYAESSAVSAAGRPQPATGDPG